MSEFKFACPVCGQHVTCDSADSGSQMECPTCYRKLVVPQAPAGDASKFILSATQVAAKKPVTEIAPAETAQPPARGLSPAWAGGALLALAGAGLLIAKLAGPKTPSPPPGESPPNEVVEAPAPLAPADARWQLDLHAATIPASNATGRILGRDFSLQRATLQDGTLALRQGPTWPPDVGVTILLPHRAAWDFAGKRFLVETNFAGKSPRVVLRIKEDQREITQSVNGGYAMRLEFDAIDGDRLPRPTLESHERWAKER